MEKKKSSKKVKKTGAPAPARGAAKILAFLNDGDVPDFLTTVIQEAIDQACAHLDPHPFFLTHEPGHEDHDKLLLTALCKRARMLSLSDLEKSTAGLARHIAAIYRHPLTPTSLYNNVGNFVTDGSNMRISACELSSDSLVDTRDDISLAEEWTWQPQTIKRIIEITNKYEESEAKK